MAIQMREGWVLCRNGDVGFARLTHTTDHWPWSFGKWTFRNDGTQSFHRDCKSEHDVVELLDPWDARVPEEYRLSPPVPTPVANADETPAEAELTPEPVKAEPFTVVDQPVVKTRTLDACGWRVYGITEGDDHPRVVLEPDNRDNELSLEAARAYAAAILAVCEEIER